MRNLIQEMDYEKPIASGSLRFEREGQATGMVEAWRFTKALDGYHVLRIEVDSNDLTNQKLLLFHVLLNPEMEIERAKFRFFASPFEVQGDLQFEMDGFSLDRLLVNKSEKKKVRKVDEIMYKSDAVFSVPTIAGLSLVAAKVRDDRRIPVITLDKASNFAALESYTDFSYGVEEMRVVLRQTVAVRPCSIRHQDKETMLWLDEYNWPVQVEFSDGREAADVAYWRYQPIDDAAASSA